MKAKIRDYSQPAIDRAAFALQIDRPHLDFAGAYRAVLDGARPTDAAMAAHRESLKPRRGATIAPDHSHISGENVQTCPERV